MTQLDEFEKIAQLHGSDSKRGHIKNYFDVTGRVMDHVAFNSLSARIGKALRIGGRFHKYAGTLVLPDANPRGKAAEWTIGHEPATDDVEINFDESPIVAKIHALITQPGMPAYELASTPALMRTALQRVSRGSHISQREIGDGLTAQEYERRLKALNEEASREREAEQKNRIAELARVVEYFTTGQGTPAPARGGNGRLVTRRREDESRRIDRTIENREDDTH